jgi:hypothetical protein
MKHGVPRGLAMRTFTSLMKTETLKLIYVVYFHSIMAYGIILGKFNLQQKSALLPK